jgi:hypothetical protein
VTKRRPSPPAGRLPYVLVALLLAAGVALRIVHFPVAVYTPDEDAYANFYAVPLYEHGLARLPDLVREYDARADLHDFPSPTRVGHLWAIVGLMNLLNDDSVQTAARVSALASMLALALLAWMGWRFVNPWAACAALAFALASPLDLAMARRAWGDELFGLVALAALAAFLAHLEAPARGRARVVCLVFAAASVLVKETGLVLLALATLGLALVDGRAAGARGALRSLAAGTIALALAAGALALACGGVEPLRAALVRLFGGGANAYMREYQSGGPAYYPRGLAAVQPVAMALGFAAAAIAVARPAWLAPAAGLTGRADDARRTAAALRALGAFALAFALVAALWSQKNLRFLSPIYAPLFLLAGALAASLAVRLGGRAGSGRARAVAWAVAIVLLAVAVADERRFVELFVRRGIPDLATPWFTRPAGS